MSWRCIAALVVGIGFGSSSAFAQGEPEEAVVEAPAETSAERWLIHLEPAVGLSLGQPQSDRFGPAIVGAFGVSRSVAPAFLIGLRLRGGLLFDGPTPSNEAIADPGIGTFSSLGLAFRLRPFGRGDDPRRGTGLWLEALGSVTLTGGDIRPSFEAGVGWGFEVGDVDLGPAVRYMHVIQPGEDNLDNRDAKMLILGLELTFLDGRDAPAVVETAPSQRDRDYDTILDVDDPCPDEAEDFDAFEDEDGCPDLDNDGDGISDNLDECPNDPEDADGFEDEDGCPEPDNDRDGILDVDDACPDEPEVVNGVDDQDGCPDEGLIEMIDDRIVLEETVLFDFERARVKSRARPILAAIVELVRQHPEWTRMRIEGHADVRGNAAYNRTLSERRARNVLRALVDAGLDPSRADSMGFGSDNPRDLGDSEQSHQRNRRVEFVVLQQVAAPSATEDPEVMTFDNDAGSEDESSEGAAGDAEVMTFDSDAAVDTEGEATP
ncbi:MAG: OmpA family protein [Myxococcota bacterium]